MTRFEEMIYFFAKNLKKNWTRYLHHFSKKAATIGVCKIKVDITLGFKAGLTILQVMF